MLIREIIERLDEFDPDMEILFNDNEYGPNPITHIYEERPFGFEKAVVIVE